MSTRRALLRPALTTALFLIIALVCGMIVANTLRAPVRGSTVTYTAEFTDVEGLLVGDPVTESGVRIGRVSAVGLTRGDDTELARVRLEVESDRFVAADTEAVVRYGDMLGARYVELVRPPAGAAAPDRLPAGGTIPVSATAGPVDLTALMNGFRPLFDALEPERADELARGFVEVFNGRGDALAAMQNMIGELAGDLVDRGPVVTEMIDRLTELAETVDGRADDLAVMIDGLSRLGAVTVGDGERLAGVLDHGALAVARTAAAIDADPDALDRLIGRTHAMTATWLEQTGPFVAFLAGLPQTGDALGRATSYGGFVNLYLCTMHLEAGDLRVNMLGETNSPVCR